MAPIPFAIQSHLGHALNHREGLNHIVVSLFGRQWRYGVVTFIFKTTLSKVNINTLEQPGIAPLDSGYNVYHDIILVTQGRRARMDHPMGDRCTWTQQILSYHG